MRYPENPLTNLRRAQSLSIYEFCKLLCIDEADWRRYEMGKNAPDYVFLRCQRVFKVDAEVLKKGLMDYRRFNYKARTLDNLYKGLKRETSA